MTQTKYQLLIRSHFIFFSPAFNYFKVSSSVFEFHSKKKLQETRGKNHFFFILLLGNIKLIFSWRDISWLRIYFYFSFGCCRVKCLRLIASSGTYFQVKCHLVRFSLDHIYRQIDSNERSNKHNIFFFHFFIRV